MSKLNYFRFEVTPEGPGYGPFDGFGNYIPTYRIEVGYNGKRLTTQSYMPPVEVGLMESFLEHLVRQATEALRKALGDEADKAAKAHIDRKRDEFVNAVDAYRAGRVK
jgi:hypothetical protein